jgi:hypothetical protein
MLFIFAPAGSLLDEGVSALIPVRFIRSSDQASCLPLTHLLQLILVSIYNYVKISQEKRCNGTFLQVPALTSIWV